MEKFSALTGEDVSGNCLLENAVKKLLICIREKAEEQIISAEELLDTFVQPMLNACEKAMNADTKDPYAVYKAARVLAEAYDSVMTALEQ